MSEYKALWRGGPEFAAGEFAVSTDSVLLADFAQPRKNDRIMDLGCGSGLLCVLAGTAAPGAVIRGIEINSRWAEECRRNLEYNGIAAEITTSDLREHRRIFSAGSCSLVISNPPYFPEGSGYRAEGAVSAARSEENCTLEDVCSCAAFLCKTGGRFCLVHRADRLSTALCTMTAAGLEPKRLRLVQYRLGSVPSLALVEGRRGGNPGLSVLPTLILKNEDGTDTGEVKRIYHLEDM